LDQHLNDGLGTGQIYEFFGISASGKTQMCLTACYLATSTSTATCLYFDTNGSFSSERIVEIAKERLVLDDDVEFLPCEEVLRDKIQVIRCHELFQLISTLQEVFQAISSDKLSFYRDLRMIIIDSIASLLSPYIGNDPKLLSLISQAATLLKVLANEYAIVVIVTNNVVNDYETKERRSALGEFWKNVSNFQILLDFKMSEIGVPRRFCKLIKSRVNENSQVSFMITKAGTIDVPVI
jgi:RecA/RadA recombinase